MTSRGRISQRSPLGRDGAATVDRTDALVRIARAARRWAFRYDRAGLARLAMPRRLSGGDPWEPIRLRAFVPGPRHHPRGEDVLAQARAAWEETCATGEAIAQSLGIGRTTLTRWAQTGGWIRPDGAHSPIGRPRNPGFRTRMQQRIEARHRLGEAERMLEGMEGSRHCEERSDEATQGPPSPDQAAPGLLRSARNDDGATLEAVFGLLRGAARIVGRPLPVERLIATTRARRRRG